MLSYQSAVEAWTGPWACPSSTKAPLQSHLQERTTLVTGCSSCRGIRWRVWLLRAGLTATRVLTGASAVPSTSRATPGRELLACALSSSSGCPCPASMRTQGGRDLAALHMAEANLHASVSSHFLVLLGCSRCEHRCTVLVGLLYQQLLQGWHACQFHAARAAHTRAPKAQVKRVVSSLVADWVSVRVLFAVVWVLPRAGCALMHAFWPADGRALLCGVGGTREGRMGGRL